MQYFTTYFDLNYLSRGIVLYNSLKENCDDFELYVLCLDEYTQNYFKVNKKNYPKVITIKLADLENADVELNTCKSNRSTIEYYFTLSPCLPLFLLKNYGLPHICSLDADILFLSDPISLFNYLCEYSVIITPHKFSPEIQSLEQLGVFNVSFQIFKNDNTGFMCLETWRKECIEWCGDYFDKDNNRFADQKYLDKWPSLYPGKVKVLNDNISGLAPWNLNNFKIEEKENIFYSNGEKIIYYHFQHFKILRKRLASNGFYFYNTKVYKEINRIYLKYWNKLDNINKQLRRDKDELKRSHLATDPDLYSKLINEGGVYYRKSPDKIQHVDFQTFLGRIIKFFIKYYA